MGLRLPTTIKKDGIRLVRQSCGRCGGCMDQDMCIDLGNTGYNTIWVLRCIQCGDMVDEVILRNRAAVNANARSIAA